MLFFIMALGNRIVTQTANFLRTPAAPQVSIEVFKADALDVELLVYEGTTLASMSDVTSITFLVKETEFGTAALMSQTETAFTAGTTGKNCTFSFTAQECNLAQAVRRRNEFYVVIYAIRADSEKVTLATGKLVMHWDGNPTNISDAEINPDLTLTLAQAAAMFVKHSAAQALTAAAQAVALANMGITFTANGYLRVEDGDGNVSHLSLIAGEPPET